MIHKLTKLTTRVLAILFAVFATSGAWAAVPTVVWDGDFDTTTKTGADGVEYTFTVNPLGNSGENLNTLSGGNLVIGSGSTYGGQISWNYNSSETYTSVLIKYSNFTATDNKVLASVSAETTTGGNAGQVVDDCVSVLSAANSTLTGRFNNNSRTWPNNGNSVATSSESGYMLIVYGSGQAFQFYTSSDGVTWNGGTATGLSFANTFACGVGLGGMSGLGKDVNGTANNGYGVSSGMTIQGVAIFRGVALTTNLVRPPSSFDSEYTDSNNKKWKYANATFTWKSSSGTDIGSSTGTSVSLFSLPSDADTSVSFACGGNATWTGSNFWEGFCLGRGTYSAPGYAFRVTSSHSNKSITAGFSPLTLGGLIIESGASGVNFSDNSRATILGAASGDDETWFGIYDNATISRGGFLKFSGNVNLEIAKGKTFTVVASSIVKTVTDANGTSTDGGIFRMHGLGTITVPTLTATGGATLDYSDVQEDADVVRSTTPFIQGNLTIDATTKFVFPAGLAKETAYTLCSGTLNGPSEMVTDITVGTTVIKNVPLTFSGNTVSYGDPVYAATVDGTTVTWDGDEPSSFDDIVVTFSGSGTVTGLSGSGTTINAADGVTVDVTNFTSPTLLGAGTFRWTANYPTTVPTGDFSYEYVGTGVSTEIANVTANGYLKTSGNIALASFTLNNGGTLEVESGMTMVQAKQQLALSGNITIDSGATFSNLLTANSHDDDAVNYDQQGMKIIVRGTLAMGSTRWSLRQKSYHEFRLYDGAMITGTGDGNGALDWIENCGGQLDTYGGTVTISANMRVRSGATTANWVASGATCKFTGSTSGEGGFSKSGAGTLSFEGTHTQTGGVSASDGTIALNNISMTSSTITLSSASASPTLKMIATDAATTVSAAVNVPANARGTLAFEGAGTFALNGPNTSGNIVWLSSNPVPGALQLNGNVNINNGSRGSSYVINKIASGTGNLGLTAWTGTYDNNDTALTYTINTIAADDYSGTIALANKSTDNRASTFNFSIGNIVGTATYGTPLVKLTKSISAKGENATGENTINVNLLSTTFNGGTATFLYDDTANAEGIYLAEASYNGTPYKTLDLAITAMETAEGNPADIIVYNSAATIPSGYGLVTPASGNMTLRSAGNGELIYWAAGNSGDWSGEASNGTHTFYTAAGGTSTTPYVSGDTVVFTSDTQIWSKTAAHGAKFQIGTDTAQAEVHSTRSGDNCNDYILDGSTIEIKSGSTLVAERYGDTEPPTQAYTGWNSYNSHNGSEINDTTITGAGTFKVGGNTGGHGAAAAILSGTSTIADTVTVEFADGATLTVPSVSAFSGSGVVTLEVSDLTLSSSGTTLITFTTAPSAEDIASKMVPSSGAVLKLDGLTLKAYPIVAIYDGENYATFKEAIDAALADEGGEANLANITVVDGSAELPGGYYIENNEVKQYPAAVVYAEGDPDYYTTVQAAVNAANFKTYQSQPYEYVAVYADAAVTTAMTLKIKPINDVVVTVTVSDLTSESALNHEADEDGVITYTIDPTPTDYAWSVESGVWNTTVVAPWRYGANIEAMRTPSNVDTVIFASDATVSVGENISVSSIKVSSALTLNKASADVTVTAATGGIVLTDRDATITVSGVTLSPAPTTNVGGGATVKRIGDTYKVVYGTIFSVY